MYLKSSEIKTLLSSAFFSMFWLIAVSMTLTGIWPPLEKGTKAFSDQSCFWNFQGTHKVFTTKYITATCLVVKVPWIEMESKHFPHLGQRKCHQNMIIGPFWMLYEKLATFS